MKTILITGINSGSARHLLSLIGQEQVRIIGTYRRQKPQLDTRIEFTQVDLSKHMEVSELFSKYRPDEVYHLAGTSTNQFEIDYINNVVTTKNILDTIVMLGSKCRILLIGSSAEYGLQSDFNSPVKEEAETNPVSYYGLTKLMQTNLGIFYFRVYSMDLCIARTFNIFDMESRNLNLFIGRILFQIEEVLNDKRCNIEVGNLEAKRDYVHVADVAAGYKLIMAHGKAGNVYNVGSGLTIKINELMDYLLKVNDLRNVKITHQIPNKNKIDIPSLTADITKIKTLGWQMKHSITNSEIGN